MSEKRDSEREREGERQIGTALYRFVTEKETKAIEKRNQRPN